MAIFALAKRLPTFATPCLDGSVVPSAIFFCYQEDESKKIEQQKIMKWKIVAYMPSNWFPALSNYATSYQIGIYISEYCRHFFSENLNELLVIVISEQLFFFSSHFDFKYSFLRISMLLCIALWSWSCHLPWQAVTQFCIWSSSCINMIQCSEIWDNTRQCNTIQ